MRSYVLPVGYLIGAILTFAHVFNASYIPSPPLRDCSAYQTTEKAWTDCALDNISAKYGNPGFESGVPAVVAGIVWPLYWVGRVAIQVVP